MRVIVISVFLFLFLIAGAANATEWQAMRIGLSADGQTWVEQDVLVPSDGYTFAFMLGQPVFVWGPEFDPENLPAAADNLCKCNTHMSSRCACENMCRAHWHDFWCNFHDSGEGTCVP
jgi:hypothetical protein